MSQAALFQNYSMFMYLRELIGGTIQTKPDFMFTNPG